MSDEEKPVEEEKPITIEATLMPLDRPLASGTIYPREVVEEAVKRLQGPISVKRVLGEFDPKEIGPNVRLADATHTLVKLEVGGDNELIGKVELMKTPAGLELRDFLRAGNRVRLAPRGMGHRNEEGKVSDYTLVCVDIVPVDPEEDEGGFSIGCRVKDEEG